MKIAINGFGHIGRTIFKIAFERPGIEIVAINDIADHKVLAHLLKHDSLYGIYNRNIAFKEDALLVDETEVPFFSVQNPALLPWKKMDIDVVVETMDQMEQITGKQVSYTDHFDAGVKKVILAVPVQDATHRTIVLGVNDEEITPDDVFFSSTNSTTNCLVPVVKVLHDAFGVSEGLINAIHAYNNDQMLQDSPHKDLRRSRAAALNIIPMGNGAATDIGKLIPELAGKFNGMAMSVPVAIGSLVDLVVKLTEKVTQDQVNAAFKAAAEGQMQGILEYNDAPLVSSDIRGNSHSAIVDAPSTIVQGDGFIKVIAWYDNVFGYSSRIVDLAEKLI